MFKQILTAILLSVVSTASFSAAFIKIGDIKGESQDQQHKDEINILAWSWNASSAARSTCISDLNIVKYVDASSVPLLVGQAEGTEYSLAKLSVATSGGTDRPFDYLTIEMVNARITSISTGGSSNERIVENVTIGFDTLKYTYTGQDPRGSQLPPQTGTITASGKCN